MLHILWIVLKTAILIIAVLIGIVLLVLLTCLFVPVRYRAKGSYYGVPDGTACISWLCHIFSFKITYKGENSWSFKIFGIPVLYKGREKKEAKKRTKRRKKHEPEPSLTVQEISADEAEEYEGKDESFLYEPEKEDNRPKRKKENPLKKIKELIKKIFNRIKDVREKKEQLTAWMQKEENKKTLELLFKHIKRVLKHILPVKMKGILRFGFDDPYVTGQVTSGAAVFYPLYAKKLQLYPVFDENILEGELFIRGRVRLATVLWSIFLLYRDKNIRSFIRRKN